MASGKISLSGTVRKFGNEINLDSFPDLKHFTGLSVWSIKINPIDRKCPYFCEVWMKEFGEEILIATSRPAFANPGSFEITFVFEPSVPFYKQQFVLKYYRLDAGGVRYNLILEKVS